MKVQLHFPPVLAALAVCVSLTLPTACNRKLDPEDLSGEGRSIVVLFENDVHCSMGGYVTLAGLRDAVRDTAYAAVVSGGDFLQGGAVGAISRGQFVIDVMNSVHYDAVTLGNHEFDYKVPRLLELTSELNAPVVCANLYDMTHHNVFEPFVICEYGDKRIAYVGVLTPYTQYKDEQYAFYDSEGGPLYDTRRDSYVSLVQASVNLVRARGADYVIVLSHLGESADGFEYSADGLIAATTGIDAVLDAHSHMVVDARVPNREGKEVILCQTGSQFQNIGKLVISKDGDFSVSLLPTADLDVPVNQEVKAAVDRVEAQMEELANRVAFHSDYDLNMTDGQGNWVIRNSETNAGDLVTDAMRYGLQSQIALINGGAIRTDVPAGDIRYRQVIDLVPYEDYVWKVEATGDKILKVLTSGVRILPAENGDFVQCSGLRYTAHASDHTVSDVQVLQDDGSYAPLDPAGKYSVALLDFCVLGGGFGGVFNNCPMLLSSNVLYRDLVVEYVNDVLGGTIGAEYAHPQGRITVVE